MRNYNHDSCYFLYCKRTLMSPVILPKDLKKNLKKQLWTNTKSKHCVNWALTQHLMLLKWSSIDYSKAHCMRKPRAGAFYKLQHTTVSLHIKCCRCRTAKLVELSLRAHDWTIFEKYKFNYLIISWIKYKIIKRWVKTNSINYDTTYGKSITYGNEARVEFR